MKGIGNALADLDGKSGPTRRTILRRGWIKRWPTFALSLALVRSAAIDELGKTKKSTFRPTLAFLILRQLPF